MESTILIITNKNDLASDFLICRFIELGIKYFRFNSDDTDTSRITFYQSNDCESIISTHENTVNLSKVSGVYYRRKIHPKTSEKIKEDQRSFVSGELQHLLEGIIWNPEIIWVNSMAAVDIAERKPYQLRVAKSIGLPTPKTLISNSPDKIHDFMASNKSVICKPIFHGRHGDSAVYTRMVSKDELLDPEKIAVCPVFLQEEIPKGSDIRLTIIGEDHYCIEITSKDSSLLDWRIPNAPIVQNICEFPADLVLKSKLLLKKLGLRYGAFDFVKSTTGGYYFLEVNAAGEWAWQEIELGLPMRDSLISALKGE